METANFMGLSQAGAPVMTRGSSRSPTRDAANTSSIVVPTKASGRFEDQARLRRSLGRDARADLAIMAHPSGYLLGRAEVGHVDHGVRLRFPGRGYRQKVGLRKQELPLCNQSLRCPLRAVNSSLYTLRP